jgi:hypothetical protein
MWPSRRFEDFEAKAAESRLASAGRAAADLRREPVAERVDRRNADAVRAA